MPAVTNSSDDTSKEISLPGLSKRVKRLLANDKLVSDTTVQEYKTVISLLRTLGKNLKAEESPNHHNLAVVAYYQADLLSRSAETYKVAVNSDEKIRQYNYACHAINCIMHVLDMDNREKQEMFIQPIKRYLASLTEEVLSQLPQKAQDRLKQNIVKLKQQFPEHFGKCQKARQAINFYVDDLGAFRATLMGVGAMFGFMAPAGGLLAAGLWGLAGNRVGNVIDTKLVEPCRKKLR